MTVHLEYPERVATRGTGDPLVLTVLLDTSLDPNGRRTYPTFLNQKRAEYPRLDSDRPGHHREPLGEALERIESWLKTGLREGNRGVAIFTEIGGDWFEAVQFPAPLENRFEIADRPIIAPLVRALSSRPTVAVVVISREHLRMFRVRQGSVVDEVHTRRETSLAPRHEDAGYVESRFRGRRLEQVRQSMAEFAAEVEQFVRRSQAESVVVLGTAENIGRLRAALPDHVVERIVHTGPVRSEGPAAEILTDLEPILERVRRQEDRAIVDRYYERVRHGYLATAGLQSTLSALQAGRVESLLVGADGVAEGSRCSRCGFVFGPGVGVCAYDGAPTENGVALVEELLRIARHQGVAVRFFDQPALEEARGFGALLKY